jgi:uncharacterized protein
MKIAIKVIPRASRQRLVLDANGTIRCYVTSPPEDGRANKEVVALFAERLKRPARDIEIDQGLTSPHKVLDIAGFASVDELYQALGFERQASVPLGKKSQLPR